MADRSKGVLLAVILVALTAGCGGSGRCTFGDMRCDGQTLMSCIMTDSGEGWDPIPCPVACRELGDNQALCIDSSVRVSACSQDGPACWDNHATLCVQGYPSQTIACATGSTCMVAAGCGAFCATGPYMGTCLNKPGVCVDGNIVPCECGYPTASRTSCVGGTCVVDDQYMPHCTLSPTTDSRCGDPTQSTSGFCDVAVAYLCVDGYVTSRVPCIAPQECIADTSQGTMSCGS